MEVPKTPTNETIAKALDELAVRLEERESNPFRVQAYLTAAETVRKTQRPLVDIYAEDGFDGLTALPGIGDSIATRLIGYLHTGRLELLDRLVTSRSPKRLFMRVAGIGEDMAERIQDELHLETLEDLELAAHDGRLARLEGFGPRRVQAVRDQLNTMLSRSARRRVRQQQQTELALYGVAPHRTGQPSVALLLDLDQTYRQRSAADTLRKIAPRRFNPSGKAWLPILRIWKNHWNFTVLFSNTARAHELEKTNDWVVIYYEHAGDEGQCTVVTEARGDLKGKRVVRGREAECLRYYETSLAQAA